MRKDKKFNMIEENPFLNLISTSMKGGNPNSILGICTHVDVLDKGHVSYVSHMGSDLTVVNAARVSFNKESSWENKKVYDGVGEADEHITEITDVSSKDKKLIHYLAKNQHWTPFAHPQITIRIKTPLFIRAQLGKHQVGLVMNEISRRYVTYQPEFYTPAWRTAPTNGAKQGSGHFMFSSQDEQNCKIMDFEYENIINMALNCYNKMLENGVAPEQARSILPQSMYTEWWWTGSLFAFSRIYNQRIEIHSQWESREYAKAIGYIISSLFPVSWKQLTESI